MNATVLILVWLQNSNSDINCQISPGLIQPVNQVVSTTDIHGKNLSWSLFLIKLQAFSLATLLKRGSMNIAKFLETPNLKSICKRLLLKRG